MNQILELFKTDTFWALLTTGLIYLSGAWLRPLVEKLPKNNVVFRIIRLVHLVLNKADPGGNEPTKFVTLCLAVFWLSQSACSASFEEARLVRIPMRATVTRNDAQCQAYDRSHRIWGGIEYGALAVTGASGLSSIPVDNDTGKAALAITAVVFATTAAVGKFENDEATKLWTEKCSDNAQTVAR